MKLLSSERAEDAGGPANLAAPVSSEAPDSSDAPVRGVEVHRRILLFDSDPTFYRDLRALLSNEPQRWELTYAMSAEDAIIQLETANFDALVADGSFSSPEGTSLLETARTMQPAMARLVFVGQEHPPLQRVVPLAHQILGKDCGPNVFHASLTRACRLQGLLADTRIRSLVTGLDRLPPEPAIYARLSQVMSAPQPAMDEVAATVESDIAISARVLQLVNSTFFGLGRHITDIRHAVGYLGMSAIQLMVLSAEVMEMASNRPGIPGFSADVLHSHGEATGILARGLVERGETTDAFAAGLLQDAGQLVMCAVCPNEFSLALRTASDEGVPLHEAELAMWGFTHAEVGAFLLGLWGLPMNVVDAVAHHHNAPSLGHRHVEISDAIYAARVQIQLGAELGLDPFDQVPPCSQDWLERTGLASKVDFEIS